MQLIEFYLLIIYSKVNEKQKKLIEKKRVFIFKKFFVNLFFLYFFNLKKRMIIFKFFILLGYFKYRSGSF